MKYPRIWIAVHGGEYEAAEHKDAPPEVLRLLSRGDYDIREIVASNPAAPLDVLKWFMEEDSMWRFVAMNPKVPPDLLREIATHSDWLVRTAVADNRVTPPEILGQLATDEKRAVRQNVAKNHSTPAETLAEMAATGGWKTLDNLNIRIQVAGNPNTPPSILQRLAKDRFLQVLEMVAANSSTPVDVLRQLARRSGPNGSIPHWVVLNPNTPDDLLRVLLNNDFRVVREAAAEVLEQRGLKP